MISENNKIPVLTEFRFGALPDSTWWTNAFWAGIKEHKISYALGWRNAGCKASRYEFYVSYKGHASARDFMKFYSERKLISKRNHQTTLVSLRKYL